GVVCGCDDACDGALRGRADLTGQRGWRSIIAAHAQAPAALTGQVSSAAEGPMEGVVVSAKRDASTLTISVVSDNAGKFSFPASKLEPGRYSLAILAVGYALDGPKPADVAAGSTATAD